MKNQTREHSEPDVLLVSPNGGTAIVLRALLSSLGFSLATATDITEALEELKETIRWVVMDYEAPVELRLRVMAEARRQRLQTEFIVLDSTQNLDSILEVMGYGSLAA